MQVTTYFAFNDPPIGAAVSLYGPLGATHIPENASSQLGVATIFEIQRLLVQRLTQVFDPYHWDGSCSPQDLYKQYQQPPHVAAL